MNVITLLDRFSWVGGANSSFSTPWVEFPSDYRRAELLIDVKTTDGNAIAYTLESSIDTDGTLNVVSGSTPTTPSVDHSEISSKLATLVRVTLATSGTAAHAVLSIWLLPKRD